MRQRLAILITLILTGQIAFGQTYSSLITDKEIYDFLNWMTKTEKKYDEEPFLKRKHIYYKISPWEIANFVKADTLKNSPEFDFQFLFKKRGGLDTLFLFS